ncbi:MAG: ABC transporter substrate-binding protein, partial [Eubacterium sp.]|nr:ABC transporter substrate-binding protein [Eubacterium sp.]
GEDNDEYYDVKIKASKILLENIDNTFVTPVYNGSTSLRNAAGQLIEEVAKSTRRKETVDDTYMSALYEKINALYRLDQIGDSEKKDFGALPTASVVLIAAFVTAWTLIITFSIIGFIKKRKNER